MKNITIFKLCLFVALFGLAMPSYTQTRPDKVKITEEKFEKLDNRVSISMNLILDGMNVKRNDLVILTPVLKSNKNKKDSLRLPSVIVTGGLRNKIINRKNSLGENLPFSEEPKIITKRINNKSQTVDYSLSVPYKPWMDEASLYVVKAVSGCANCYADAGDLLITYDILPKKEPASYKLSFIIPEVEIKARNDRHTATFNYIVDRYELLRDYKFNAEEFARVDKVISEIKDDKDIQITEFSIVGYASPESGFEHNRILSANRANSFANYLVTKFGIARSKFTVQGLGEDWQGLRKAVAESSLFDKQAILEIIDRVPDPDLRDIDLKRLSNGETYRTLLNNYYPRLRRTEYTIAYVVRPFNVEEAKEIIKTKPRLLSLNEMFLVAQSYPSNSKEFREVFDIATRLYPESDIAIINSAAADIEGRNIDAAIERLKKIESNPKAWNNLGVAYILKDDSEKAKEYLTKAAANGNADAQNNLETLKNNIK